MPFDLMIVDDAILDGSHAATITASAAGHIDGGDQILVHDNEHATLFVSVPQTAVEGDGVLVGQATVTISQAPDDDVVVSLRSSDTTEATVPATVTVRAGQTSAVFDLTVVDDAELDGTQTAAITAHVENWTDGTDAIDVQDNDGNISVELPAKVWEGQGTLAGAGTVILDVPLSSDLEVSLRSDDPDELGVPAVVTVPAGHTSAAFDLYVRDDGEFDGSQSVNVSATATGLTGGSAAMEVGDDDVHHYGIDPIAGPQTAGVAFPVTVTAQDVNGETILVYAGADCGLSASGDGGPIVVAPGLLGAFTNGAWTAGVTVLGTDTNVVLTAADLSGAAGDSNPFDVVSGPLDHFEFSPIASPQGTNSPFQVTLTALDANGYTVTDFSGMFELSGFVGGGPTTVEILTFITYADQAQEYPNTLQAISNHFTDYNETPTTTTDPAALAAQLVGKDVFLVVEQEGTSGGIMAGLGGSWAAVLGDFVSDGGMVIVCSDHQDEYQILQSSGLMGLSKIGNLSTMEVAPSMVHPLTEGVPGAFLGNWISYYSTANGTVVMETVASGDAVVIARDVGDGHAVMIGTDYYTIGTDMDRIVANAIRWAQGPGVIPVNITPTSVTLIDGVWQGNVTVSEAAVDMYLEADDGSGHVCTSNTFTVETSSRAPRSVALASGSDTGLPGDGVTNLNNSGAGEVLRFIVAGTIPGADVAVYADGVLIGTARAPAYPPVTVVTTDGLTVLSDGVHTITARQTEPGLPESPATPGVEVTVDTQAPRVTAFGVSSSYSRWALGTVDSSVWTGGRGERTAPWAVIDRLVMEFDEPVVAAADDLTVTGG
ncbi:MAG: hypothetical protein WBF17_21165, partial [Phycisphaerae bacterium]